MKVANVLAMAAVGGLVAGLAGCGGAPATPADPTAAEPHKDCCKAGEDPNHCKDCKEGDAVHHGAADHHHEGADHDHAHDAPKAPEAPAAPAPTP